MRARACVSACALRSLDVSDCQEMELGALHTQMEARVILKPLRHLVRVEPNLQLQCAMCNCNVCIRKIKRKKGAEERPGVLFSVFTIDEVCVCTDVHASGEVSHYLRVNDSTS